MATAKNKGIDIVAISEQYRNKDEKDGWYGDASGRAAIVAMGSLQVDRIGPSLQGFRWIEANRIRLYSCYCSPNVTLTEFEDFLGRLETSIRESDFPAVVAGDFNSKSGTWGSPIEDARGNRLADLMVVTQWPYTSCAVVSVRRPCLRGCCWAVTIVGKAVWLPFGPPTIQLYNSKTQ